MHSKRLNLKAFRVKHDLTQEQIASMLNVSKHSYTAIENGLRSGNNIFWNNLQKAFKVPDQEMWLLQKATGSESCAEKI